MEDLKNETGTSFWSVLLSVIIPPIGVFLKDGVGFHLLLNVILTFFGYVPGLIHAIWIVTRKNPAVE